MQTKNAEYLLLAQLMAEERGIRIQSVNANTASTDGKTIYLPTKASIKGQKLMLGYVVHEVGHITFSNFDLKPKNQLERKLTNILEDIRMEQMQINLYPGAKRVMKDTVDEIKADGLFRSPTADSHPIEICTASMLFYGRGFLLKQNLTSEADIAISLMKEAIGESKTTAILACVTKAHIAHCEDQCLQLAKRIINIMQEDDSTSDDSTSDDSTSDDSTSDDSISDDSTSDDEQSDDEQSDDSPSESQSPQGACDKDNDGTSGAGDFVEQITNASDDDIDRHAHGDLSDVLNGSLGQEESEDLYDGFSFPTTSKSNEGHFDTTRAAAIASKCSSKLRSLVTAKNLQSKSSAAKGKRIGSKYLWRTAINNPKIFQTKSEVIGQNAHVCILIDVSGSMEGERCDIALQSAYALAQSLELMDGVKTSVALYPGYSGDVSPIKNIHETLRAKQGYFAQTARGGTPMAEALMWSIGQHQHSTAMKKITICLTDGEPNNGTSVKNTLMHSQELGIQSIGIGILEEGVQNYFKHSEYIDSLDALPETMFKVSKQSLFA